MRIDEVLSKHNLTRADALQLLRSFGPQAQLVADDLSGVLSNVAGRLMKDTFASLAPTWPTWAAEASIDRFSGEIAHVVPGRSLDAVQPGAPYPTFKLTGATTGVTLTKKAASLPVTWEMTLADDQSVMETAIRQMTLAAIEAEEDAVYTALAAGSFAASLTAGTGAPAAARLDVMRGQLAALTDAAGDTLYLRPGVVLCPEGLAHQTAEACYQFNQTVDESQRLRIVTSSRLTGTAWYLLPRPDQLPIVALAFLSGQRQPEVTQVRKGDGLTVNIRHTFGAVLVNTTAIKNAGA